MYEETVDEEADSLEQMFHNTVREQIIFLLLFIVLYLSSYPLIDTYRKNISQSLCTTDEDEVTVYRISLWLCTFSLAVSVGSALLLPFSIVSNEILILYPKSYYVKWLNSSLIQGLWNHVFLFSNMSLFVFLPFAYLFSESSGFIGSRSGLLSRVYETFTVLILLSFVALGLAYIVSAFIYEDRAGIETLLNLWTYLPFLYSCISCLGAIVLLVCTPVGLTHLFGVLSNALVKPMFLRDLNEEFHIYTFEKQTLQRRLENAMMSGDSYITPEPICPDPGSTGSSTLEPSADDGEPVATYSECGETSKPLLRLRNGALQTGLSERLQLIDEQRKEVDRQRKTSSFRRNIVYPIAMLLLLALTSIAVLMVIQNTLELLIGIKALPLSTRQFTLGIASLSKLGWAGACLEVVLILYLQAASLTGLYSLPVCLPGAPLPRIILICAVLLVLSTAAPLLVKILGITNFDLLGDFGRIEWLGHFRFVLLYNVMFATVTIWCLATEFTATVRRELYNRLKAIADFIFARDSASVAKAKAARSDSQQPQEPPRLVKMDKTLER